jgi:hypothetical protein
MPRGSPRLRTDDDRRNIVGIRVLERRLEFKLAQDVVCARIATASKGRWSPDRQEVYKIEAGTRTVTDLELIVLSTVLGKSANWLLTGDDPR